MFDVIIVGAGPVGLYLGVLLLQEGLSVRILEQRTEPNQHSRAIGIHPPALAALNRAGVASTMAAEGVRIPFGLALSGGDEVARLSFAQASKQWPFVLTLKQVRTEALLEARIAELDPLAIVRGFEVDALRDAGAVVTLTGHRAAGGSQPQAAGQPGTVDQREACQARLVVGADGAHSTLRRLLRIPTSGRNYPDHYLMGDFPDPGSTGATAVLHLEPGGIVESFPLPGRLRRWVVHTHSLLTGATAKDLAVLIKERTGVEVEADANSMLSAFDVRSRIARRMVQGRAVLVGDAAHEISPIGGQGMNLGWLDAQALAPIMVAALQGQATGDRLKKFQQARMRASRTAARQAWLNMALGRPLPASFLRLRHGVLGLLLHLPAVGDWVARRFTMAHLR